MHWNFVIITKNDSNNWISRSLPKFEKFIWTWLKFWTPTLLKPTYLSLPWSEFKYFSAHHIENFLNFLELTQLLSLCQFWRSLWAFKQNRPCYLSYFVIVTFSNIQWQKMTNSLAIIHIIILITIIILIIILLYIYTI